MKKTIAIYKNLRHGYTFIAECEQWDKMPGGLRISDPVEVEFSMNLTGGEDARESEIERAREAVAEAEKNLEVLVHARY